ncbi:MAG: zinc-binding dehydrogenase [Bacteroidetes bacterium]|nr:MAG: zinc-binding dehydrogenase [Bacteroidota bacterium]
MKSIIITEFGGPEVLKLHQRAIPVPKDNEVLIKIHAAGINRPDIFQRRGNYPPPPGASPDIPGLEVSGTVAETGKNVSRWKIDDAVCALLAGGGYAEFATVPEGQCLPMPKSLNLIEAASLPETVFTVWHNVFQRGKLSAKENFLVHGGSGGIGTTAIQLAYAIGAKVFTTTGSLEKCNACLKLGAFSCVNYKEENFEKAWEEVGIDCILDIVGGNYFESNIRLLREEGRLVYINAIKGSGVPLDIRTVMNKRLYITGSTLRSRSVEFKSELAKEIENRVWPLIESGKFKPLIYRVLPLEQAAEAHVLMESGEHIGKIVLSV